jgi:hypothetical protein
MEKEEPKTPLQSESKEGEDSKTWINNVVGQAVESLSHCDLERKGVHHHMFVIECTHKNENHQQNCKYPIFHKNLTMSKKNI